MSRISLRAAMAARYGTPVGLERLTVGTEPDGKRRFRRQVGTMRWISGAALVAAGVAGGVAGGVAARQVIANRMPLVPGRGREPEWLVVTVYRAPTDLAPDGTLPEPLARLGDGVEVRIRPAPGDRGTELSARPRLAAEAGTFATRDAWRTV